MMKKTTAISVEIPEYLQAAVNTLVRYYSEGWRAGYLEGFTKMGAAIISPIGAIGGLKPHTVNVEQDNVQIIANGDYGTEPPNDTVCIHASKEIYGDCACDKEVGPEKPKRKKRVTTEAMRKTLVKEFIDDNPVIECLAEVKKSERKSIFDALKKG